MAIRQLVREGVKGKFVCLPVLRGGLAISVPCAASASCYCWHWKAPLHKLWYFLNNSGVGAQAAEQIGLFSCQQCMCINRPRDCCAGTFSGVGGADPLCASLPLALGGFRGGMLGLLGPRVKPSNYSSVFLDLCL